MTKTKISVAQDFSRFPGPRLIRQGKFSGEAFRDDILASAFRDFDQVIVDLDGTTGFGSSFLDEAFGGLVRVSGFSKNEVREKLTLVSKEDETYTSEIMESLELASPQ